MNLAINMSYSLELVPEKLTQFTMLDLPISTYLCVLLLWLNTSSNIKRVLTNQCKTWNANATSKKSQVWWNMKECKYMVDHFLKRNINGKQIAYLLTSIDIASKHFSNHHLEICSNWRHTRELVSYAMAF